MGVTLTFPDGTTVGSDEVRGLLITLGVFLLIYYLLSAFIG